MFDNETVVEDDLESFEREFYGTAKPKEVEVEAEELETEIDETEAEVAEETDEDPVETEDEDSKEDSDEKPKKNRKSFQERINELTAKAYEAERRELETLRKLQELEQKVKPSDKTDVPAVTAPTGAPDPDAEKDGVALYPLGEFDPAYIRDLTRFTIKQEQEAAENYRHEREQQETLAKQQAALQESWNEKLATAEEELPDLREKILDLTETFSNLDPAYGKYLVDVVMTLDTGPQILHYLSTNPKTAREIVNSGPASATLALGRLDARLQKVEKEAPAPRVSRAPAPPAKVTRGTSGRFAVTDDTDDLDAFEKKFFKPRRY